MSRARQSIGIEFVFSDQYNTRRRLFLSSSFTEAKETPLLARVPLDIPVRDAWVNLCLDLPDLVAGYFQGQVSALRLCLLSCLLFRAKGASFFELCFV